MISKNNLNNNSSSSFFLQRNNTLYSPVNKKSKKMLTLNMHMFQRLKTIKKKSKDTKPKKQLHRKYTFENIKLNENTKKKIMLEIQLNTNENNINEKEEIYNNYSDKAYNIKRFLTEKQNKNINNLLVNEKDNQKELDVQLTPNKEDEIKMIEKEKEKNKQLLELGKKYNEVDKAYQLVLQNIAAIIETEKQTPLNVQLNQEEEEEKKEYKFELTSDEHFNNFIYIIIRNIQSFKNYILIIFIY